MTTDNTVPNEKKDLTKTLAWRWSIFTAIIAALILGINYIVSGSIGYISEITYEYKPILILPIRISRWWDILLGPIISTVTIFFFNRICKTPDEDWDSFKFNKEWLALFMYVFFLIGFVLGMTEGIAGSLFWGITGTALTILLFVFCKYLLWGLIRTLACWLSGK